MNPIPCSIRGKRRWKIEVPGLNGKRRRRFFTSEVKAMETIRAISKDQRDFGRAWNPLSAPEKAALMQFMDEIKSIGLTLERVLALVKAAPRVSASGCTLRRALDELLEAKRIAKRRPGHIENLRLYVGKFIAGRESMDVSQITERQLAQWFTERREKPVTQRGSMGLLSVFFDHCWRQRYITENPVKRLECPTIDYKPPTVLSYHQCCKVMAWARRHKPEMLAWLALALFAGLRPESEADFIEWKHVDLERRWITVGKSKVRGIPPRLIDLSFSPPALAWLCVARCKGSKLPLTPTSRRRYLRELRDYLGFEVWPQDVLRHTAASNLIAHHQDAGKVANFLGNSAGILLRHYKALVHREEAEKFLSLMPQRQTSPCVQRSISYAESWEELEKDDD